MAEQPSRRAIVASLTIGGAGVADLAPFVRPVHASAATQNASPIEAAYAAWETLAKAHDDACGRTWEAEMLYQEPEIPTGKNGLRIKVDPESIARMKAEIAAPFDATTSEPAQVEWDRHFHQRNIEHAREVLPLAEAWQAECRRRADGCGLTAAKEAEDRADMAATAQAKALLDMEPTTLRDACFQAVLVHGGCYYASGYENRLMKRLFKLAGIWPYWLAEA